MTWEELHEALKSLKQEGYTEEDMLKIFYLMYQDDKISYEELRGISASLGYEFTKEFENMSEEDKKTKGLTPISPKEKAKREKREEKMEKREEKKIAKHQETEEEMDSMTIDDIKDGIKHLKKKGCSEEEILNIFYRMYQNGTIPLENLRTAVEMMGYEFTEEFEKSSEENKKNKKTKKH